MKKAKRVKNDEERGYRDRMAGMYDEWFRINRADEGAEYDKGATRAALNSACPKNFDVMKAEKDDVCRISRKQIDVMKAGQDGVFYLYLNIV